MKRSFQLLVARRWANRIGVRARGLRRELRDHYRLEFSRIRLAEKRARGLRLYTAWSRHPEPRHSEGLTRVRQPAGSVA